MELITGSPTRLFGEARKRLRAGEGALGIVATDLDIEAHVACPSEVEAAGDATVPAEAFYKLLKRLPDGDVVLERTDDGRVRVKSRRSQAHLPSRAPDGMPALQTVEASHRFALPAPALVRLLSVAFAAAENVSQGYLCGVCLHIDAAGTNLCAVATDTHVLARASIAAPDGTAGMPSIILGLKAVEEIARLADAAGEGDVGLAVSAQAVEVSAGRTRLRARLVDGRYPDYGRVLPGTEPVVVEAASGELAGALDRALVITSEKGSGVRCTIAGGSMSISTRGANGAEIVDEIEVAVAGAHETSFSARLGGQILKALDCDVARIEIHPRPSGSIWCRPGDDDLFCYLMPMLG